MDRPVGHMSPEVREMAGPQGMKPREEESVAEARPDEPAPW